MNKYSETLRNIAAEIREHPERWTQGWFAKNAEGASVGPGDADAICWCIAGFIHRLNDGEAYIYSKFVRKVLGVGDEAEKVGEWNDEPGRTAAEVAEMFEKSAAIADGTCIELMS